MAHKDHHLRRNFWMHCLEGGCYMSGLAFISPETVLPSFVKSLGGSVNLVALMPVLLPASFSVLGLFVAPLVERLHHLKPFVVLFGAVQRLPYLIAALLMFSLPQSRAVLLPIVVLTPIISGLIGGVGVNAWMEMVTRMIPEHLRASGWAIRYVIQGVIGLAAGPVIHWMLSRHSDAAGYAWLHLICFAFLALSFCAQLLMRETTDPHPLRLPQPSYKAYLRQLPVMLTEQPRLIRLIFARFTGLGWLMLVSFLTIHALKATGRPPADVGHLVLASMLGSLAGNIFAGWIGNRSGGRALMLFSRVLCLLLCAGLPFIHSFPGFLAMLFILGFGLFVDRVGDLTFSAELCPRERRPTYQAILSFCQAVALIVAASLSGLTFFLTQNFLGVVALIAVFAATSLLILRGIPEVRGLGANGHASPVMGETTPMV
ncbi:MAG: MFS transporter [Verrucomicrobia bacterium]|nr:MFS transporter [Verrucomicrobiota bacterium]